MSFTMRADESVTRGLRSRATAQLAKAIDTLDDPRQPLSERIHEMRTSIKKVRALLAMVRSSSPRKTRRADRRLRKLAGTTSAVRDAHVMLETVDNLLSPTAGDKRADASNLRATLTSVRGRLAARLRAAERTCERERQTETLARKLSRERRRVRTWVPPRGGKWDKLWRGPCVALSKSYRRARRAMGVAFAEQSPEAFHDWRKAVKAHRYQLQFLQGVWPRDISPDLADLEHLGELLGHEHDLTVLRAMLVEEMSQQSDKALNRAGNAAWRDAPNLATTAAAQGGQHEQMAQLLEQLDERRHALRAQAQPIGQRLFQQRARLFRRRLQERLHGERATRAPHNRDAVLEVISAHQRSRDTTSAGGSTWIPVGRDPA